MKFWCLGPPLVTLGRSGIAAHGPLVQARSERKALQPLDALGRRDFPHDITRIAEDEGEQDHSYDHHTQPGPAEIDFALKIRQAVCYPR